MLLVDEAGERAIVQALEQAPVLIQPVLRLQALIQLGARRGWPNDEREAPQQKADDHHSDEKDSGQSAPGYRGVGAGG